MYTAGSPLGCSSCSSSTCTARFTGSLTTRKGPLQFDAYADCPSATVSKANTYAPTGTPLSVRPLL